MGDSTRDWLARALSGRTPGWPIDADLKTSDLLDAAEREGVVALADWHLQRLEQVPGELTIPQDVVRAFAEKARDAAMLSMLLESEARTVLRCMSQAGIPGLLLKGSALAYWAYSRPHCRECGDVDVLVPSRDAAEALAAQLCRAGYARSEPSGQLVAYELMCRRQLGETLNLEVDVHWRLSNSALFAEAFTFDELMRDSVPIPILGESARGLGPVHACIHACTHRALNLSIGTADTLKWLYDVALLADSFVGPDWARLVAISSDTGLAGVVLSGLEAAASVYHRKLPAGACAALRSASRKEALDASRLTDWAYMQKKTFAALPTAFHRMRWMWQRVFPSKAYMGYLYDADARSYGGLMLVRVGKLLRRFKSSS